VRDAATVVSVFDVAGRKVATLHDGTLRAGTHALEWEAGRETGALAPGLYFVRATAGEGTTTRKVVVIR
jgi:hypothetical protein